MSATISALSLIYVRVPVQATKAGVQYNPTADSVVMAFVPVGTVPASGDWKAATWEVENATAQVPTYNARCLVGPGGTVQLAQGSYVVWVKVTDSPEIPVLQSDALTVRL